MPKSRDLSPDEIRAQLQRLERSALFAGSDRLVVLLRFVVNEALEGKAGSLREAAIGNAVYGRDPPYDPRIDSTVRVEARRLRRKLQEYYDSEGRADAIRITLPTGGYVPAFAPLRAGDAAQDAIFEKGSGAALAIMPIRALSGGAEDESFADGLTDELIFAFGRAPGLRVASRSTSFQYKDRPYPLAQLARELGVDGVLQGTMRRDGDMIRVTLEMSDPNGFVVWSDRFDAPDEERMRLQERIAATALSRARFDSSPLRERQTGPRPQALEASALVYRARQLLDQQTPAALQEALGIFARVNHLASDYARGHSGIADVHCDLFRLGLIDRAAAAAAARPAAQRALEIDPRSAEAQCAAATISAWFDWDREAADAGFRKALGFNENARAARVYAVFLTILERHDEAERLFRTARAIEPFSIQQDIAEAISHYQSRRYHLLLDGKAERGAERTHCEVLAAVALAHLFGGRPEGARAIAAGIGDGASGLPDLVFAGAEIEAWLGERDRGRRLLEANEGKASRFARATLAAALRDDERSLEALEETVHRRELSMAWVKTDQRFDHLRALPRFNALLDRIGPPAP